MENNTWLLPEIPAWVIMIHGYTIYVCCMWQWKSVHINIKKLKGRNQTPKQNLPPADLVFHILSSNSTIANTWDKSPHNRKIFMMKLSNFAPRNNSPWIASRHKAWDNMRNVTLRAMIHPQSHRRDRDRGETCMVREALATFLSRKIMIDRQFSTMKTYPNVVLGCVWHESRKWTLWCICFLNSTCLKQLRASAACNIANGLQPRLQLSHVVTTQCFSVNDFNVCLVATCSFNFTFAKVSIPPK